jgi:hypothetical protein
MERRVHRMFLFHPTKRASALITVLFVLTFLAGINLLIGEQARQTILTIRAEKRDTQVKILADEFLLKNQKHRITHFTDARYGAVERNEDNSLTIKVNKGDTVKVEFNESGY